MNTAPTATTTPSQTANASIWARLVMLSVVVGLLAAIALPVHVR